MAYFLFIKRKDLLKNIVEGNQPFYNFLKNKWYFDEVYEFIFVRSLKKTGIYFWKKIDGLIIDRFGPDGMTFPAKVNTNTGKMEIYEGNSVGGKEQQDKINNRDNLMKKMLSNRYEDLMNE